MEKSFAPWEWTLEPYEKFGPISLASGLSRQDLEELFGPPAQDLTKDGKGRIAYDDGTAQLFAWIDEDGSVANFLLPRYPFLIDMKTQKRSTRAPLEKEQIAAWLMSEDALTYEKEISQDLTCLIAPTMGLLWDPKIECFCIYPKNQQIHLLLPENYNTASIEFLGEPQFLQELHHLRSKHPDLFHDSWSPTLTRKADGKRGLPHCHYGGAPVLKNDEPSPRCKVCKEPLSLLVQMDLAYLPESLQKQYGNEGLFQLFHCGTENCICEHSDPDDPPDLIYLARILKEKNLRVASKKEVRPLPQRQIAGWIKEPDGPQDDELEKALGKPLEEIFSEDFGEECYRFHFPYTTDKWGGDPSWVQGHNLIELLHICPDCKERSPVQFVTQYNSNDDFTCADGKIFVFQCVKHKDRFFVLLET